MSERTQLPIPVRFEPRDPFLIPNSRPMQTPHEQEIQRQLSDCTYPGDRTPWQQAVLVDGLLATIADMRLRWRDVKQTVDRIGGVGDGK